MVSPKYPDSAAAVQYTGRITTVVLLLNVRVCLWIHADRTRLDRMWDTDGKKLGRTNIAHFIIRLNWTRHRHSSELNQIFAACAVWKGIPIYVVENLHNLEHRCHSVPVSPCRIQDLPQSPKSIFLRTQHVCAELMFACKDGSVLHEHDYKRFYLENVLADLQRLESCCILHPKI